jgi:multidrug transporter EmrE-like cation transporter
MVGEILRIMVYLDVWLKHLFIGTSHAHTNPCSMKELLLTGAIISNVLTNIGFKYSALNEAVPAKKWGYLALGLVFGLINSVLFAETLRFMSLQVASTLFFSLTIVGLYLVSVFWFNETVTLLRLAGAVVVIIGVVMMSVK